MIFFTVYFAIMNTMFFTDKPEYFYSWFQLVQKKRPDVNKLIIRSKKLKEIECSGIVEIEAEHGKLMELIAPDVIHANICDNYLPIIDLPNARFIDCSDNPIEHIIAPKVEILIYSDDCHPCLDIPTTARIYLRTTLRR
jgi:hypothetical protein